MAAVAAVAFCGFIAALVAYAFAPEKLQGWKWLATVLLVFSVLIVPRVTVGIVDKTGGSAVKVVANIPFGVAFLGSVTSTVGHTLTGLFETGIQVFPGIGALSRLAQFAKRQVLASTTVNDCLPRSAYGFVLCPLAAAVAEPPQQSRFAPPVANSLTQPQLLAPGSSQASPPPPHGWTPEF